MNLMPTYIMPSPVSVQPVQVSQTQMPLLDFNELVLQVKNHITAQFRGQEVVLETQLVPKHPQIADEANSLTIQPTPVPTSVPTTMSATVPATCTQVPTACIRPAVTITTLPNQSAGPTKAKRKKLDAGVVRVTAPPTVGAKKPPVPTWNLCEIISNKVGVSYATVKEILEMRKQGATLPYIYRYRHTEINYISMCNLMSIDEELRRLLRVRQRAQELAGKLASEERLTPLAREAIFQASTFETLDFICEPFVICGRQAEAVKARTSEYRFTALSFFRGNRAIRDYRILSRILETGGQQKWNEALDSMQFVVAEELVRKPKVLAVMEAVCRFPDIRLLATRAAEIPDASARFEEHFRHYFKFQREIALLSTREVIDINRGDELGILSVDVDLPWFAIDMLSAVVEQNMCKYLDTESKELISKIIKICVHSLCKPFIKCVVRAQLTRRAERDVIRMCSSSLLSLLLMPPVRGGAVLGVGPDAETGCALAVISKHGELLEHRTIDPDWRPREEAKLHLTELLQRYGCSRVAIGCGKGSLLVTELIMAGVREGCFGHDVRYSIVHEDNVPEYSTAVTSKAKDKKKKKLPDPNASLHGAVAIARFLQDPLDGYLRQEPTHRHFNGYDLQYVNEQKLREKLHETVVQCVSFVGVDLNVCPAYVLRRVAGLNATLAANIVAYRQIYGPFMNREQLRLVPEVDPVAYEQCAGFVKVCPETVQQCLAKAISAGTHIRDPKAVGISDELEPLDATIIHPKSYALARKLIKELNLNVDQVGSADFINAVCNAINPDAITMLVAKLETTLDSVIFILQALAARCDSDLRDGGSASVSSDLSLTIRDLRSDFYCDWNACCRS